MRRVVLVICCVVLSATEAVLVPHQLQPPVSESRGALESLISTARDTRESIVREELPYSVMRAVLSRVYNHSTISVQPFIDPWVRYSQNYLYISSFVLFVGVVFPLVTLGLWAFWECCHETNQEDDEEEEHRHTTVSSQLITWSLAVAIFIFLLLICVFLGVLLAGNSLLSSGVQEGGEAVGVVLPELARVRDCALEEMENLLNVQYNQLRQRVNEKTISMVGSEIVSDLSSKVEADRESFYSDVRNELQLAVTLHNHTLSILSHLSSLPARLRPLNSSFIALVTACTAVVESAELANTSLSALCENVTEQLRLGPPPLSPLPPALVELSELLSVGDTGELDVFDTYLEDVLSPKLLTGATSVTDEFIGPSSLFGLSLSTFLSSTLHYYNTTLTFDLPMSQLQLNEYLGPRFLDNWEMIRYACTLTFALIVLLLGVCLLVPVGRGLLSVLAVYNGGDELTHSESAHQAGTTLKKVAFLFVGVCVVSSASFGLFLSLSGVLGPACGPQENFSPVIANVIDHRDSWGGAYPLGSALIGNKSYPLLLGDVLESCRSNVSLYESLHLEARLDLSELSFSEQVEYRTKMRGFANSLSHFDPLTPALAMLLLQLHNATLVDVEWVELHTLTTDSLFAEQFSQLKRLIVDIELALSEVPVFDANGVTNETLSAILSSTEHALFEFLSYTDQVLSPAVNSSAVALQEGLSMIRASELRNQALTLSESVAGNSTKISREKLSLASEDVIMEVESYSSHSRASLRSETGSCSSLAGLADQFSIAFCHKVVPGLDVFWATLLVILSLSLFIPPLSLLLAGRLIDPELKETFSTKFHYWGSVFRQLRAICWLLLSLGVCLWLVVSMSRDQFFRDRFCESAGAGCCVECVWGMGIVFLLLSIGVGGVSQLYQCVLIHRITKCVHAKVKRLWLQRKKAVQFYTQLLILLLQDVPFLILAGLYSTPPNTLTVPALFTLTVSLTGILAYILYLLLERANILSYFVLLKKSLTTSVCSKRGRGELTVGEGVGNGHANGVIPMATRRHGRGRYGSSESEQSDDSQGTTQQDGDWQYSTTGNHRLSNIPEQPEGVELASRNPPGVSPSPPRGFRPPTSSGGTGSRVLPPPLPVHTLDDDESYSELSQAQQANTVILDHLDPSNEAAMAFRREAAIRQPMVGGVEVAPLEFATPTNSDFGSSYSVISEYPGYYSSQQHDNDYRDDYSDSDYSQLPSQRSRPSFHISGIVGEVSMDV